MAKRPDKLRLLALIAMLSSIIYFYLMIFAPYRIPYFLKFGPMPRSMNVLFMGVDIAYDKTRHVPLKETGHTDTMILVNINPASFQINMLSMPRDTLVEIPNFGFQKINAAYYLGGADLAKKTVEKYLDVPVNHYVVLNTRGVIKLIDLLGGIRVYVDKDMYYEDKWGGLKINLKEGWQNLSGEQAHGFVRYRLDPFGDVSRVQRQQGFMQTVLKKLASPAMLAKAPWVMALAFESINTDMSLKDILCILNFARGLPREDIKMTMVPGSFAIGESNSSIWATDTEELQPIINKHFSKKLLAKLVPLKVPSSAISIIDNSNDLDSVRQMVRVLNNKEYMILNISDQKRPNIAKTQVIAQKGDNEGARKLAKMLGINDVIVASTGDPLSDFTIVICDDWRQSIESGSPK